jgi:LmbE family N-acetylglucosaminyl deacetylase
LLAATLALWACGDNELDPGPPLAPADLLMIVAHPDDDMIFMQPQLANALARGSVTTVYVLSGDPVHGLDRAQQRFSAVMTAYAHAARAREWDCGYLNVAGFAVHHCRLRDRAVSMIGLDLPDGGRYEAREESLLHLVENSVSSLPGLGPLGGRVTRDGLVAVLAELVVATSPRELHTLDIAATHGDDHPGHLAAASFALWGAASANFAGTMISHRGYNVAGEAVNLSDEDYAVAKPMMGRYAACFDGCARCGTECVTLDESHDTWLRRQYSTSSSGTASGKLASGLGATSACLAAGRDRSLGLVDCAAATTIRLGTDRHLHAGELCAASPDNVDDPISLVACADEPAQYWRIDGEGLVVNGRPPMGTADMAFDHIRCLQAAAVVGAPICGNRLRPRWSLLP